MRCRWLDIVSEIGRDDTASVRARWHGLRKMLLCRDGARSSAKDQDHGSGEKSRGLDAQRAQVGSGDELAWPRG